MTIPRIRGRVGQAEEAGHEHNGKWFFELYFSVLGGGTDDKPLGVFGPYETEQEAKVALKGAAKMACEVVEKDATGTTSGKYLDLRTNEVRPWDEN